MPDIPSSSAGDPGGGRASAARRRAREWLGRVFIESLLIMLSITMALAVDQWKSDRQDRALARKSLQSFQREIQLNHRRLEDIAPYHAGLRAMLAKMDSAGRPGDAELREVVGREGLRLPSLLDAAWQTALATGVLRHMDYETVSALSMTYTLQSRFNELGRDQAPVLTGDTRLHQDEVLAATLRYLTDVTGEEEQLQTVYAQALQTIGGKLALTR
jgi:hypothetical protein